MKSQNQSDNMIFKIKSGIEPEFDANGEAIGAAAFKNTNGSLMCWSQSLMPLMIMTWWDCEQIVRGTIKNGTKGDKVHNFLDPPPPPPLG